MTHGTRTVRRFGTSERRRGCGALILSLLLAGAYGGLAHPEAAYAEDEFLTEHVFLVIIDGLRWTESFGDPLHEHIPCIWDSLRPQGTIYKQLYNTEKTQSTGSHSVMMNGNRFDGMAPNNAWIPPDTDLPLYPTLFELYRKQTGAPRSRCWVLTGNPVLRDLDRSRYPTYGDSMGAYLRWDIQNQHASDDTVWAWVQQVMDDERPSLMLINFFDVDLGGHHNWDEYIPAIEHVDSLIHELWKKIQAVPPYEDPYYQDKTTLLVTTDHGRDAANYHHHTKCDIGCRHLLFLALGPDIEAGLEVTGPHDWIDICTTIAALMDISTPYAEGGLMDEMFVPGRRCRADSVERIGPVGGQTGETRLTFEGALSEYPTVAGEDSSLYVAWNDARDGFSGIYFKRSSDGGTTWSPDTLLVDTYAIAPRMVADGGVLHLVWVEFVQRLGQPVTMDWELRYMRSTDGGLGWSDPAHLTPQGYGAFYPALAASGGEVACFVTGMPKHPQWQYAMAPAFIASSDNGLTWGQMAKITGPLIRRHPQSGGIGFGSDAIHTIRSTFVEHNWEIYYARSTDGGATWVDEENLSQSSRESRLSDIAVDGTIVYAVWSEWLESLWQIVFRKSTDDGVTWEPLVQLTSSEEGALSPQLTCSGGHLWLVWTDFASGRGETYWMESTDGGESWSSETPLSTGDSLSLHPALALIGDEPFVAWQDNRDGNWEIYLSSISQARQRAAVDGSRRVPAGSSRGWR
jgi:hypothetical protein